MQVPQPIRWTPEGVVMLDQRRLPAEEVYHTYTDYRDVANAIKDMVIRGAPAIGLAAAMGVAIGVDGSRARNLAELRAEFPKICETLAQTRPTAVDLFWALERNCSTCLRLTGWGFVVFMLRSVQLAFRSKYR